MNERMHERNNAIIHARTQTVTIYSSKQTPPDRIKLELLLDSIFPYFYSIEKHSPGFSAKSLGNHSVFLSLTAPIIIVY